MGAKKRKWTDEEEAAVRAGVEKYGPGKWRAIQRDVKFGPCLTSRSNVDLKDKWRNLTASANELGLKRERKSQALKGESAGLRTVTEEAAAVAPFPSLSPDGDSKPLVEVKQNHDHDNPSDSPSEGRPAIKSTVSIRNPEGLSEKVRRSPRFSTDLAKKMRGYTNTKKRENVVDAEVARSRMETAWKATRTALLAKNMRDYMNTTKRECGVDAEVARSTMDTASEAARKALQAVVEAETAATAAEEAAREAEIAEAEADAAEAAAEAGLQRLQRQLYI